MNYRTKIYTKGHVTVKRHVLDWDRLEDDTVVRIAEALRTPSFFYLNPEFTLTAPPTIKPKEFYRQAQRALVLWMKTLDHQIGKATKRKLMIETNELNRRILYHGIVIEKGVIIPTTQWIRQKKNKHRQRISSGDSNRNSEAKIHDC